MITVSGKITEIGETDEERRKPKFPSSPTFTMSKVREVDYEMNSTVEVEVNKKVIWVAFNSNGSICSTSENQPSTKCDQWDNPWHKMVSE